MKIKNINKEGDIFEVTKEPNIVEKLLGFKKTIERYNYIHRFLSLLSKY